jgi:capsular polysaccharide biosynthesis protein
MAVRVVYVLWRHRILVALSVVLAVVAGMAVAFKIGIPPKLQSRQYTVGVASASALIDTPTSQVVDLGLKSSAAGASLPGRAALLASLLTTSPLRNEVAQRAGIDVGTLIATAPAAEVGEGGPRKGPLATGATVKPGDRRASSVTLETDTTLPIITVNVESHDAATATRLANSTIGVLQEHVSELAGQGAVPQNQRLIVKQLGPASAATMKRGGSTATAVGVGLMVFLLGCGLIYLFSSMAKEWHRTAAELDAQERAELRAVQDEAPLAPVQPLRKQGG